jgi:antitoxin VapB
MRAATTKLFKSNTTQAVRLPKDVAFPDDVSEVEIIVTGDSRVIVPTGGRMAHYLANRRPVPDDFMVERDQPPMQERSWLD